MRHFLRAQAIAAKFRNLKKLPAPVAAGGKPRIWSKAPAKEDPAAPDVGELFIYENIGFDLMTCDGITGKTVAEALTELKGCKLLNVFINSEGGDVFEAKAIYSQLVRFGDDADVVMHIDGIAASAATFIAMAGDRIITSPVATWMVHQAWSGAMGRAEDMRAMADLLDLENETIAQTYATRTKKPVDQMRALMSAPPDGTWMNAAKALELGFTDEISADEDDGEDFGPKDAVGSPVSSALALTQRRLKSLSAGQLLSAKVDMHRRG